MNSFKWVWDRLKGKKPEELRKTSTVSTRSSYTKSSDDSTDTPAIVNNMLLYDMMTSKSSSNHTDTFTGHGGSSGGAGTSVDYSSDSSTAHSSAGSHSNHDSSSSSHSSYDSSSSSHSSYDSSYDSSSSSHSSYDSSHSSSSWDSGSSSSYDSGSSSSD